ncbi:Low molecular weight phosphotyrosine protein phosphatase like [Verticillium longisporum]|nr:Low molecular weight phosphotyrosine protein phosphatase like [Verticillium longisporum]
MPEKKVSVLFVCLGNICRSTMAEGVFREIAKEPQYKDLIGRVDSSGTGAYHIGEGAYHIGEGPDHRTMSTLEAHGITDYVHHARKVRLSDFDDFDYVFAMDRHNLRDLESLQQRGKPDSRAKVQLWGEYSGSKKAEEVDDPYYGGKQGFQTAYEQCTRFSRNFLADVFPNLWGEYSGSKKAEEVDDPYYGGKQGFQTAYEQCTRFSRNFLADVFPHVKTA